MHLKCCVLSYIYRTKIVCRYQCIIFKKKNSKNGINNNSGNVLYKIKIAIISSFTVILFYAV